MITVQGQIVSGGGASDGCCSDMQAVLSFAFAQTIPDTAKAFGRQSVNSPASFVALPGVGSSGNVTQGLFLYLKCPQRIMIRLTQKGTATLDPDIVSTFPAQGMVLMQFPIENPLKLLEVQGIGPVEYLVAGNI